MKSVNQYLHTKKQLRLYTQIVSVIRHEKATRNDLDYVRRAIEAIWFGPYEDGEDFEPFRGSDEIEIEE